MTEIKRLADICPNLDVFRAREISYLDFKHKTSAGRSFGASIRYKSAALIVKGCLTQEAAYKHVDDEINRRGWKFREHWWQVWRPARRSRFAP